jgi:hypothetical protein
MIHFNQKLVLAGAIALVTLTAGYKTPVFAKDTPKATTAPTAAPAASKTSGFTTLQTVVAKTISAVETGKLPMAKEEFSKFEDAWTKVEDGVKKKSPDAYKAIEDSKGMFMKELKAAKPSKTKLMAELQSLDKAIAKAAKA